jgi:hypothetical protein
MFCRLALFSVFLTVLGWPMASLRRTGPQRGYGIPLNLRQALLADFGFLLPDSRYLVADIRNMLGGFLVLIIGSD